MAKASNAALDKFKESFAKSYGEDSIRTSQPNYETISTGSIALDRAMGAGGIVLGRVTEVWGPPSGGKSSLLTVAAGHAQRQYPDKLVGYIDVEQTFDWDWARKLGADPDKMVIVRPGLAEEVADMNKEMLESNLFSMIILDSVGAMLPKEEAEKNADQVSVGTIAKIITRMVKISAAFAPKANTAVVIINQVRANLGYGADTTTGGGFALKHVTTHKLNVKRASSPYTVGTEQNKVNVGYEMGVKVEKNKIAPEGRNVKFDFFTMDTEKYGPIGINQIQEAFVLGVQDKIIKQGGSSYTLPDGQKFVGKDNAIAALAQDPKMVSQIRDQVIAGVADQLVDDNIQATAEAAKAAI